MKLKVTLSLAAAALALLTNNAFAQAASAPDRAAVKADTAAAKKKGELLPAGEGMPTTKTEKSMKSKEEAKAATKDAKAKGELPKTGEAGAAPAATAKSTKTKAEAKAETADAKKKGELAPAGEATPGVKK